MNTIGYSLLNTVIPNLCSLNPDVAGVSESNMRSLPRMRIFDRPVCLLHVPKTGGTAFRHYLESLFFPEEIIRITDTSGLNRRNKALLAKRGTLFVSGHFGYEFLAQLESTPWSLTFLRHPVDRVLSTYHYWKTVGTAGAKPKIARLLRRVGGMSIEEFVSDAEVRPYINNAACAAIGQTAGSAFDGIWTATNDQLAFARLDQMDFVGVTERMNESVAQAARVLNLPSPGAVPKENVTAAEWSRMRLPAGVEKKILRLNESDLTLWEAANRRLDEDSAGRTISVGRARLDDRFRPETSRGGYRLSVGNRPLVASGWLARDHRPDARIASLPGPSALDVPWPYADECFMVIVLKDIASDVEIERLQVSIDGSPRPTRIAKWERAALAVVQCAVPKFPELYARVELQTGALTERELQAKPTSTDQALFAVTDIHWSDAATVADLLLDLCGEVMGRLGDQLSDVRAHATNLAADASTRAAFCHALIESGSAKDREIVALDAEVNSKIFQLNALAVSLRAKNAEVGELNKLLRQKESQMQGLGQCLAEQRVGAEQAIEFNRELIAAAASKDDYALNLLSVIQRKDDELARLREVLRREQSAITRLASLSVHSKPNR